MRVLVTGAAGMIGSHVVDALQARGDFVVALDNLSSGQIQNIRPDVPFFHADIRNKESLVQVFTEFGPFDAVIHQAAVINQGITSEDTAIDIAVNIEGTRNLLELSREHGVDRFIYASSVAVYGRPTQLPAVEHKTIPLPVASYGVCKLAAEHYVSYFCRDTSMSYACLRYGNIYGPRQSSNGEVGVIGVFIESASRGLPITVYGDGKQSRDFLYVADCVEATLAALSVEGNVVLNIAAGKSTSLSQIVDALTSVCGRAIQINQKPARKGDIGNFWCDIGEAKLALNWRPVSDLIAGIRATLEWRSSVPTQNSWR